MLFKFSKFYFLSFLSSCVIGAPSEILISKSDHLVDLSHDYGDNTLMWPGAGTKFEINNRIDKVQDGYEYTAQSFCTAEHAGTHMDAPVHFVKGKWTVDQIPIDRLTALAVVVNITEKASNNSDAQLTPDDIASWEAQHGRIPDGSIVLMYSGWERYWGDEAAYLGNAVGDTSKLHFPGFHPEAAQFLVSNRSIVGVGVDTASTDSGASSDFPSHQIIAQANIYGLENVANVDKLPPKDAVLYVMPMKIRGGTGAPCRIFASKPSQHHLI